MRNKTSLNRIKLLRAGNAVYTTYQPFSEDLEDFGFVEKVENAREEFQLPKRVD